MINSFLKERNLFEVNFDNFEDFRNFVTEKVVSFCCDDECKERITQLLDKKLHIFPAVFGKYYTIIHIYDESVEKTQLLLFRNNKLLLFKRHKYLKDNYINLLFVIISNKKNSQHYMKLKGRIIRVLETFNKEINENLNKISLQQLRNNLAGYERNILNLKY